MLTLIGALLLIPLSVLVSGFTLSTLWGWFMQPLGLPPVSILQAYGVVLVFSCLHHTPESKDESLTAALARVIIKAAVLLTFGFVVHSLL